MRLVDNTDLIVPRERERLMAFQRAEAALGRDTTFSGDDAADADAMTAAVRTLPEEFQSVECDRGVK
jgi:beta-aspartyl-peptidase (threonine type)